MKKILIILMLLPVISVAQEDLSESDTIFLDARWNQTNYRSQAKYFREMNEYTSDSILEVRDYYLETGIIQMIGTYRGQMKRTNQTGEFRYFYPDGTLKAIYEYTGGLVNGKLEKYYTNGSIMSSEKYDLGIQIDTIKNYYENGQLRKIEVVNPEFNSKSEAEKFKKVFLLEAYTPDGEHQIINGNGEYVEYFLSGKKRSSIEYEGGFPHGKMILYNGQKKKRSSKMTFKHGKFIKGELYDNGKKDIFGTISRKAYFPTGARGLDDFIELNIGSCEDIDDKEFIIMVAITTEGHITFEQIISGNATPCQLEELQMLIKNMPIWVPAIENGRYVDANQAIRIEYK